MIKGKLAHSKGADGLVIGLSQKNWDNLKAGKPIAFKGHEVGLPLGEVVIIGGETEDDIREDLKALGWLR